MNVFCECGYVLTANLYPQVSGCRGSPLSKDLRWHIYWLCLGLTIHHCDPLNPVRQDKSGTREINVLDEAEVCFLLLYLFVAAEPTSLITSNHLTTVISLLLNLCIFIQRRGKGELM